MKNKSTNIQQLIGISDFTQNGILLNDGSENIFFVIKPTNIAVLSSDGVAEKIGELAGVLETIPEIEFICLDADENLDENRRFLDGRIKAEQNVKIRELLRKDKKFLDDMQTKAASSRIFIMSLKAKGKTPEQIYSLITVTESALSANGFAFNRAEKDELKRMLAGYFGNRTFGRTPQDFDGEDMLRHWLNSDESENAQGV